jgi:hypothetical protein
MTEDEALMTLLFRILVNTLQSVFIKEIGLQLDKLDKSPDFGNKTTHVSSQDFGKSDLLIASL